MHVRPRLEPALGLEAHAHPRGRPREDDRPRQQRRVLREGERTRLTGARARRSHQQFTL
jgi:hypothetical protein